MNVLVLGTLDARQPDIRAYYGHYQEFFQKAAEGAGLSEGDVRVFTSILDDLLIKISIDGMTIEDTHNHRPLEAYDVIFTRGHGFMEWQDVMAVITDFCENHGVRMINQYRAIRRTSKLLQTAQFASHGVRVPYTVSLNSAAVASKETLGLTTPFIMKAIDGSLGNGNHLIRNWDEIHGIAEAHPKTRYILQEFIQNDGDYRLFFMGNEMLPIYRQAVSGSHLNNTSKGGQATLHEIGSIPDAVIADARTLMHTYGMTMAGVDVMRSSADGEYYFLEINAQPQLVTGAFVPEKQATLGRLLRSLNQR